ncbi:MAG: hypothetical protein ACD_5C00309G0001 [uncultured bacterium]|nr:MAG: hypothetical protein ACD_5C00309G0001 [uncultured bacterium]
MEKILLEHPWIILIILIWTLPWKAAALWKAARRGHLGWFFTIILFNTLAILDILYIFFFSKPSEKENNEKQDEVRQAKMQRFRDQQAKKKEIEQQLLEQQEAEVKQVSIKMASRRRQTII